MIEFSAIAPEDVKVDGLFCRRMESVGEEGQGMVTTRFNLLRLKRRDPPIAWVVRQEASMDDVALAIVREEGSLAIPQLAERMDVGIGGAYMATVSLFMERKVSVNRESVVSSGYESSPSFPGPGTGLRARRFARFLKNISF